MGRGGPRREPKKKKKEEKKKKHTSSEKLRNHTDALELFPIRRDTDVNYSKVSRRLAIGFIGRESEEEKLALRTIGVIRA